MTRATQLAPAPRPGSASEPGIDIQNLVKTFTRRSGERVRAVDGVSLDVQPGEFLVLLGPSGCGKTTLLRLIAGLDRGEAGRIAIHGAVVYDHEAKVDRAPENRAAGMVFQSYALWPHMTVFQNVAYPLRSRGLGKPETAERVAAVLELVGVARLRDQYPSQMSGGQQQRVALARAVVAGDSTVLFDEPLSNVDAKVRDHLRFEILSMQRKLGFTAVYVTHDQEEAMTLGTRIAVLRDGRIAQIGKPREIYQNPVSRYVANFVGAADELPGKVVGRSGDDVLVDSVIGRLRVHQPLAEGQRDVVVIVRPEAWRIGPAARDEENRVSGTVEGSLFLGGGRIENWVRVGDTDLRVWSTGQQDELPTGSTISLSVDPSALLLFEDA
jgi:iron(III) transport system ATP-binding protein